MSDNQLPSLPGQKLEEAAANVATEAGKEIVHGVSTLMGGQLAVWFATRQAKADAARMAIETQAINDRDRMLAANRRQLEVEEVDHKALLQRRFIRLGRELEREQENLESITLRAIEFAEKSSATDKGRRLDDDWIFAFARHAQGVSDHDLQDLWAHILSAAATDGQRKLSAAALQTMTLLDKQSAIDFRNFWSAVETFGYCPAHDLAYQVETETQHIDIMNLEELGLIQETPISGAYAFEAFVLRVGPVSGARIGLLHTSFSLTRRGTEIANAVFHDADLQLSDALQNSYLENVVSNQMAQYVSMTILPALKAGEIISPFVITLTHPREDKPSMVNLSIIEDRFDDRLRKLLAWASTRYDVALSNNIPGGHDAYR
jgi:hypothetical protein